jgi:hypothetical protein
MKRVADLHPEYDLALPNPDRTADQTESGAYCNLGMNKDILLKRLAGITCMDASVRPASVPFHSLPLPCLYFTFPVPINTK